MVNLFSGHLECSSPTHAKILILKSFLSRAQMSKEYQQNSRLSSNWLFLKLFDGHAKRQFWQFYWNDFTKIWIFLTQSEKLIKKYMFFQKYFFSPKIVLDTKNAILTFQLISLLLLSKFFSYESPISWRKLYIVQESAFFQKKLLDTRNAVLTALPKFSLDSNFFFSRSPKNMNRIYPFFSNLIFPRSVSLTQRMQFWQCSWWSFAKDIFFGWKLERDESKCSFFSKKNFLKVFPGLKKMQFWQLAW